MFCSIVECAFDSTSNCVGGSRVISDPYDTLTLNTISIYMLSNPFAFFLVGKVSCVTDTEFVLVTQCECISSSARARSTKVGKDDF